MALEPTRSNNHPSKCFSRKLIYVASSGGGGGGSFRRNKSHLRRKPNELFRRPDYDRVNSVGEPCIKFAAATDKIHWGVGIIIKR